jgi:alpha-1,6-mannosyltransferase
VIAAAGMVWLSNLMPAQAVPLFWLCALLMLLASWWASQASSIHHSRYRCVGALALMHVLGLLGQPLFEDDGFRYMWDGYRTMEAGTPYGLAPEAMFTDARVPQAMEHTLSGINHPEVPTIYGPVPQYFFAASYALSKLLFNAPQERILRAFFGLAHLGLFAALLALGHSPNAWQIRAAWLYALSPLVFKEVALTGHFDFLVGMALALMVVKLRNRSCPAAFMWLSVAVASKVTAIIVWPLVVVRLGWRQGSALTIMMLLLLGALYAPLLNYAQPPALMGDWAGLSAFAQGWQFNAGVHAVMGLVLSRESALALSVLLGGLLGLLCMRHNAARPEHLAKTMLWLLAGFILLSPAVNPWYWLWLMPLTLMPRNPAQEFVCQGKQVSIQSEALTPWVFGVAALLLLSYGHGLFSGGMFGETELAPYQLHPVLQCLEHGLIALLIAFGARAQWRAVNP